LRTTGQGKRAIREPEIIEKQREGEGEGGRGVNHSGLHIKIFYFCKLSAQESAG
jgi:hypothetical protein